MGKMTFLAAAATGYVLGARAGRERYEQIRHAVDRVRSDPWVRARMSDAQNAARRRGRFAADHLSAKARQLLDRSDPDPFSPPQAARRESPRPYPTTSGGVDD